MLAEQGRVYKGGRCPIVPSCFSAQAAACQSAGIGKEASAEGLDRAGPPAGAQKAIVDWEHVSWAMPGMLTGTQVAHCALQSLSRLTVMAAAVSGPHSGHETGAGLLAVSFLLYSGHTGIPREEVAQSDLLPHRPRGSRVRQGIRLQTGLPGSAGFFLCWKRGNGERCPVRTAPSLCLAVPGWKRVQWIW